MNRVSEIVGRYKNCRVTYFIRHGGRFRTIAVKDMATVWIMQNELKIADDGSFDIDDQTVVGKILPPMNLFANAYRIRNASQFERLI